MRVRITDFFSDILLNFSKKILLIFFGKILLIFFPTRFQNNTILLLFFYFSFGFIPV